MHSYTQKNRKVAIDVFVLRRCCDIDYSVVCPFARLRSTSQAKDLCFSRGSRESFDRCSESRQHGGTERHLWSRGKEVLSSGDAVEDKAGRERFLKAYEAKNALIQDGDAKAILQIGTEDWPFPIPIVKRTAMVFRYKKGKEELINRRIGRNELNTIQTCLAYVDAQREYAAKDRDGDGLFEYAQKFVSTPGTKDGLYWEAKPGEEESPFGDLFARATREGYKKTDNKPIPYHGYFFKILKAQGKNAPGGAYDYVVKGRMIGGFGMVAYPANMVFPGS